MSLTPRPVREIGSATFSNDGTRITTADNYVTGWDVPDLQRRFRVRPLPELSGLAFQPGGDLMLSAHRKGTFALLDGRSGEIVGTCADGHPVRDSTFALSACGKFILLGRWQEWSVREISSNTVVWRHAGNVRRFLPLTARQECVVCLDQQIEVWQWPIRGAPLRTIPLPSPISGVPAVNGSLLTCASYKEILVLDLDQGRGVFSVPTGSLAQSYWSHDGSLVVVSLVDIRKQAVTLSLYSRSGELIRTIAAPSLSLHGHAFSATSDDAALVYHDGFVLIRNFREYIDSVAELPVPWIPREPRPYDSRHPPLYTQTPAVHTHIRAATQKELEMALEPFRRTAWKPLLRPERGAPDGSKLGGIPWLAASEDWPRCGQCDSRMDLFLQLNSAELPADGDPPFEGLLQVFCCTHTTYKSGLCNSSEPFSNAASVRILRSWSGTPRYTELPEEDLFDEQRIVGWTRHDDFPHSYELALAGVELDQEFPFPLPGDKLLGWADWEQGVEHVGCPRCAQPMRILFQIDSCCGVPVMLADGGRGWISQCAQHPEVVSFSWSCG